MRRKKQYTDIAIAQLRSQDPLAPGLERGPGNEVGDSRITTVRVVIGQKSRVTS